MASVKQLKRGSFIAYIYVGKDDDGKEVKTSRRFRATGLNEARRIAQDMEDELRFDFDNSDINPSFGKFYEMWHKYYAMKELDAGTREKHQYVDGNVLDYFSKYKLNKIKTITIMNFFDYETDNKRASLETKHRLLSSIFKQAINWNIIDEVENPMKNIPVPKTRNKATTDYFRPDEISVVLDLINVHNVDWQKLAFKIALIGGLRRGEILGIVEDNIDYERSGVMVKYSLQNTQLEGIVLKNTKTDNIRFVTLPEWLMNDIKTHLTANKYKKMRLANLYIDTFDYNDKIVFPLFQNDMGNLYKPNTLTQAWRKFNDKYSEFMRKVRFHDLRHSSVTYLLNQGFNMKEIQVRLGHSDIKTTLNRYSHVSESDQINAAKAFDKFKRL